MLNQTGQPRTVSSNAHAQHACICMHNRFAAAQIRLSMYSAPGLWLTTTIPTSNNKQQFHAQPVTCARKLNTGVRRASFCDVSQHVAAATPNWARCSICSAPHSAKHSSRTSACLSCISTFSVFSNTSSTSPPAPPCRSHCDTPFQVRSSNGRTTPCSGGSNVTCRKHDKGHSCSYCHLHHFQALIRGAWSPVDVSRFTETVVSCSTRSSHCDLTQCITQQQHPHLNRRLTLTCCWKAIVPHTASAIRTGD
jgi:hypothetical protein